MIESEYIKDNFKLIERLKRIPALASFNEKELEEMMSLSKIKIFQPGEVIIQEDQYDCWLYFLISGQVKIVKKNEVLHVMQRMGDVFGEMSIIDGSARSASVVAINESVCLTTDASCIDRFADNEKVKFSSILYRLFAEILADRLRVTNQELITAREEISRLKLAAGPPV
jgi:CRP/FNR family transcriptional regulator, cyclic AMP receptor protein